MPFIPIYKGDSHKKKTQRCAIFFGRHIFFPQYKMNHNVKTPVIEFMMETYSPYVIREKLLSICKRLMEISRDNVYEKIKAEKKHMETKYIAEHKWSKFIILNRLFYSYSYSLSYYCKAALDFAHLYKTNHSDQMLYNKFTELERIKYRNQNFIFLYLLRHRAKEHNIDDTELFKEMF